MPVFNIQTITQSLAAQESELTNTLTLRKIDLKLLVLLFYFISFIFFFTVTSFLKTVPDACVYSTGLAPLHLKATQIDQGGLYIFSAGWFVDVLTSQAKVQKDS